MLPHPADSPHFRFVTNLQRLLLEGEFVGSYKYALLISLARWAVENPGFEEGRELDVGELAPHFLELYWPQGKPFSPTEEVREARALYAQAVEPDLRGVLLQDRGQAESRQAPRILKKIYQAYCECGASIGKLPGEVKGELLQVTRKTIRDMPLWKLQSVRSSREPLTVLYRQGSNGFRIRFESGVAASFAHFAPLVEELARSAWLRHVLRCNPAILGAPSQVESFLFPDSRNALGNLRAPLFEVQGNACFYCAEALNKDVAVDHFLPWARYRRDLGHNFVLSHSACNSSKSDVLAGNDHLQRWVERNALHGEFLAGEFDEERIPHDQQLSLRVAQSLYALADSEGAELWMEKGLLKPIEPSWRGILGVA